MSLSTDPGDYYDAPSPPPSPPAPVVARRPSRSFACEECEGELDVACSLCEPKEERKAA
jgi:hypothetical protein